MDCVGPIIVGLIIIAQVITAIRKNQELARRRAMQMGAPEPRRPIELEPPPPRRIFVEREPEEEEEEAPPRPQLVQLAVPPPRRLAVPTTVQIGDLTKQRRGIRLNQRRVRTAIVLSEILAPPVSLR